LGYPCRHHQKVLHVGVVAQKGVGESRGDQGVFDLALDAAAGDRRVRVSLLGDLDDVLDTGPLGTVDHAQLLGENRLGDENHPQDAPHRLVDALG